MCTETDVYSNVFAAGVLILPPFHRPIALSGWMEPSISDYFILSPSVCYWSLLTATKMFCLLFKIMASVGF